MFYNLLASEYLSDKMEPIAKWLTIGILGALVLTFLAIMIVKFIYSATKNQEKQEKVSSLSKAFLKWSGLFFVFYALALGILLLVLEIAKKFDTAYLEENWVSLQVVTHVLIPLLVTLALSLVSGIILFVIAKTKPKHFKKTLLICGLVVGACLITSLILIGVHYSNNIKGDGYYTSDDAKLNPIALYVCASVLVIVTIATCFFLGRKDKKPFDTRCIAIAGVCVALSFALSYIKLWDMPTGGSITLVSLLPVMIFSYIYGTKKGLLVGFLYGVLQAVQDPWLIHPAQFLLDYPIAFSMVCFAGTLTDLKVLNKVPQVKFAISAIIAGSLRFFCHVLSGVFAFGAYALDAGATSFWSYSLIYNLYVFIDIALVVFAGCIILSSKAFNKEIEKLQPVEIKQKDINSKTI